MSRRTGSSGSDALPPRRVGEPTATLQSWSPYRYRDGSFYKPNLTASMLGSICRSLWPALPSISQVLLATALLMVGLPSNRCSRAQSLPTTNYENSGVVSEMIGSNAAGITAYTSDFVARFTSEGAKTRVNAAALRLASRYRTSRSAASRGAPVGEWGHHLGFLFASPGNGQAGQTARRIRDLLSRHGLEPSLAQALIGSLRGLLSGGQVDATKFAEAVRAHNRVVGEATASFLTDPPRELLNIRAVLASLTAAVAPEREVELSAVHTFGRDTLSSEQLRLPPPKSLEGLDIKAPLVKPGTATATPTAWGARWGQIYGALSFQPVSRYATVSKYDWQEGKWSDGTISLGAGLGNPHRWVGLDVTLNIFDTLPESLGGPDEFGTMRTLSLKLHRALPYGSAVALGYENAWRNSREEDQGGNSVYGVVTKVFTIRARRNSLFSRATVSVGLGNDRFLSESQFQRQAKGVNVFGSVGLRIWSFMNVVADWTGQDLNVGVSVTPVPHVPLVLTPALVDVTGRAGDQVRFSIGATMTYDFRR